MLYEEEIYILILRSLHITGRCNRQSVSTSFESVPHCKDRQRLLISRILVSVNTDAYIYITVWIQLKLLYIIRVKFDP